MPLVTATYTRSPFSLSLSQPSELPSILLFLSVSQSLLITHFSSSKMALTSSKASNFSLSTIAGEAQRKPTSLFSPSLSFPPSYSTFSLGLPKSAVSRNYEVSVSTAPLTGVIFEPFEEVKKDALAVPMSPQVSMARQNYADDCEAAINEQINVEYNVSYVYHSLFAYFDRDNVALKGFAKFFKESSEEEREHAEKLMKYQNIRGGQVILHPILSPSSEFEHVEKGDALYAMELSLSLEKLVNEKLLHVHNVADENDDPQMAEFIEREFLSEQVEAIKKIAEYVAQLRMVGKGHGVWHFDQRLLHEEGVHA